MVIGATAILPPSEIAERLDLDDALRRPATFARYASIAARFWLTSAKTIWPSSPCRCGNSLLERVVGRLRVGVGQAAVGRRVTLQRAAEGDAERRTRGATAPGRCGGGGSRSVRVRRACDLLVRVRAVTCAGCVSVLWTFVGCGPGTHRSMRSSSVGVADGDAAAVGRRRGCVAGCRDRSGSTCPSNLPGPMLYTVRHRVVGQNHDHVAAVRARVDASRRRAERERRVPAVRLGVDARARRDRLRVDAPAV